MSTQNVLLKSSMFEFVGTFFLIFVILNTDIPGSNIGAMGVAVTLLAAIYLSNSYSGANLNPAVSLSQLLRGKMNTTTFFYYMVVQLLAGTLAVKVFEYLNPSMINKGSLTNSSSLFT
jgi:glycerol uptake facilitator-like aquaporin